MHSGTVPSLVGSACAYNSIYSSPTHLIQQTVKTIIPTTSNISPIADAMMAIRVGQKKAYIFIVTDISQHLQISVNTDPTYLHFSDPIFTVMIHHPFLTLGVGTQRAWQLAVSTCQTVQHMAYSEKIGICALSKNLVFLICLQYNALCRVQVFHHCWVALCSSCVQLQDDRLLLL